MPDAPSTDARYAAFISYRHVEPDRRWAKWLHRALETYRVPRRLREEQDLPARVGRVFRDEEELSASSDLSQEIETALQRSRFLIVVCSPRTPASRWVNQEVVRFREMGRGDRILALLIEGEPGESFPTSLREIRPRVAEEDAAEPAGDTVEPLAADVRPPRHETAVHVRRWARLRLLSRLLGCRFDDLRRREQQRQRRRVLLAGSVLVALVVAFAALSLFALGQKAQATRERNAKAQALDDVLRLSDSKVVRDLIAEVDDLWPLHPDRADALQDWLDRSMGLLEHRTVHEDILARLREGAEEPGPPWRFADPTDDWQHAVLSDLVRDLEALTGRSDGEPGLVDEVRERLAFATDLRRRSIGVHAETWREAVEAIAASDRYGGLRIPPQVGLVPLGPDPDSGLFEFAHLGSGSIPTRDAERHLVYEDDAAIVLVLIPGGTFLMGAQSGDPDGPNYDPEADWDESPVHEVTLSPFFLAKHECTQAQWAAITGGAVPSTYKAGLTLLDGSVVTSRHPVEQISWEDCSIWLSRHCLTLPSEANWEYACRAGKHTPWCTGREAASLQGYANICDAYLRAHGGHEMFPYTDEVDDGYATHAPVGTYRSNAYGLHDVHGNVYEWCGDLFGLYPAEPVTDPVREGGPGGRGRILRGGSWNLSATQARSGYRNHNAPGDRDTDVGVRPARAIVYEEE